MQAWGNAPGKVPAIQALKARIKPSFASIPNITFIEFDTVFAKELAILLLKTTGSMMLFLTVHIFENAIKLTWAH